MKWLTALVTIAALSLGAARAATVDTSGPSQLIETAAQTMLERLEANRSEYRKDPKKVYALVDEVLLPHFDTEYSARLVLAKNWRTATPDQRKRFIDAFYKSMLHTYGDALVDFTGDRIQVLPTNVEANSDRATVRTFVKRSNGEKVPVNYSLRKTEQGWKAWDVTIEGISYVKSFRDDFGSEIDQNGLDSVIRRLEAGALPASAAGKAKTS